MKKLLFACVVIACALPLHAAFIKVSNNADSGPGSLRQAILDANASGGGTIKFTKVTGTIILQTPLPDLTQNITIDGPGAGKLAIQGLPFTVLANSAGNTATIEGLTLRGGDNYPSGVIANFGDLNLMDCTISGGAGDITLGGGVYNTGAVHIISCTFTNCEAGEGGALWNSGSMNLENCTLTNNHVANGGGSGIFNSGALTLESSTIAGNRYIFAGAGGGIYNSGGTVMVRNCSITNNSGIHGGGIWNGGLLVVANSTIAQNQAEYSSGPSPGGGIYNHTGGTAMLQNTTISGNSAQNQGGGIMNLGTVWLLNSTIDSNLASGDLRDAPIRGGGVWNSGTVYSKNTIFAGNQAFDFNMTAFPGADFFGVLISQGFNLIQDTSGCTITGVTTGNLLGVDPLLGPLQDNGGPTYTQALLPGSPAINAGTSTGAPATDQRGVSRPQGPGTDMGAFEVLYHGKKPAK